MKYKVSVKNLVDVSIVFGEIKIKAKDTRYCIYHREQHFLPVLLSKFYLMMREEVRHEVENLFTKDAFRRFPFFTNDGLLLD